MICKGCDINFNSDSAYCEACSADIARANDSVFIHDDWGKPNLVVANRAKEKQAQRAEDRELIRSGKMTAEEVRKQNSMFSFPKKRILFEDDE